MRDFIISTETNCDLSPAFIKENNICVIPHYYTVEEDVYGDGKELTNKEFYDKMREKHKVGTMASNPAVIDEMFTNIANEGKDILHISFSSALSGGCGNVQVVSNQIMEANPEMKIIVVDTLAASLGEAILIQKAVDLKAEGKTIEETAEIINELVPHLITLFTVDDLDYLYRGGRLSKTTAIVGSLVNIKPILRINEEGKLVAYSKVRGRNKSIQTLAAMMEDYLGDYKDKQLQIGIMHGDCEEDARALQRIIQEKYGYTDFFIEPIGPSIGAHSGPGTLGLVFLGDHR
ncbi:MAG: DegV family protein [Lachnospiraceae bacterium]|nr:DegV family protein [Lachnospiraceae bacterium]MDD5854025.1 DegV family protein [Lachnospiraceae bacterium]